MKNKLTLLALALGLSFAANAQIVEEEETLKPVAGNKTLEANVNFLGGTSSQLKLRSFTTEQLAFRYATGISYDYDQLPDDASQSNLTLSFAPGIEKHFAGTKRISPYIGFAVPLTVSTKHFEADHVEIKGADSQGLYGNYNRSYFSAGVSCLAGVDFYVAKNFYVGFEAGVGVNYMKYSKVEIKYKNDVDNRTVDGYYGINFDTFTSSGLRIGFVF